MKKTFLLVHSLFLLAGVKAQQTKTKSPDVIEYREGHSPEMKTQQKQAKNQTHAFPKPLDSLTRSAKMKSATGNPTIPRPLDSVKYSASVNRSITTDRKVDSVTQFIKGKVSTKKPPQAILKKPSGQQPLKRDE